MLKWGSRGQTLIETVLFLPILLVAMFGVIYVSRLGVLSERAQAAVRYGGLSAFNTSPANLYSGENIYQNLNLSALPTQCTTPPPTILSSGSVSGQTKGQQYWAPDGAPTASCAVIVSNFGGAQFLATHYFSAQSTSVQATINNPTILQSVVGNTSTASASETFVHAAYPGIILYCSQEVNNRVVDAVNASLNPTPTTTATPIPAGASPPPRGTSKC